MLRRARVTLGWMCVAGTLALGALWVRGIWRGDAVFLTLGHACAPGEDPRAPNWASWTVGTYGVASGGGVLCLYRSSETFFDYSEDAFATEARAEIHHNIGVRVQAGASGLLPWFSFSQGQPAWTDFYLSLEVPDWAIVGVLAALGWILVRDRRARRQRRGLCPECGYDVNGAFEAGCSECGWNRTPPLSGSAT